MELLSFSLTIRNGILFFRAAVLWVVVRFESSLFRVGWHTAHLQLVRKYGFNWQLFGLTYSKHQGYKHVNYFGKQKSWPIKNSH